MAFVALAIAFAGVVDAAAGCCLRFATVVVVIVVVAVVVVVFVDAVDVM